MQTTLQTSDIISQILLTAHLLIALVTFVMILKTNQKNTDNKTK